MGQTENTHLVDKVVDALRKAATEIEGLQVQAHLGKAEAADKYEELKKKFDSFVFDTKSKFNNGKDKLEKVQEDIQNLFEELRVQLALGKADGIDTFHEQKKKITNKLRDIENKIKNNPTLGKAYAIVLVEIEKFKVLLEWLEQKFNEGKDFAVENFEAGKKELNAFIDKVKDKFKEEPETTRWENFQDEMTQAFSHVKKAFTK
ncbi:hypothetical protein K6119_06425 [Paracrocinitomix mangrovi]|uniref:hypothetical protein n=1 Tax=Paracrocinitomix mangrovi TaxID=2862509 RepID=UPI001C8D7465|nr:hypothetical protein [Paracrocinitomix mangrovi]UKN03148.1 hypothetical protein K6119_06425 [Paracrocinitomix mangrovi]